MNEKQLAAIRRHDLLPFASQICVRWWVHSVGITLYACGLDVLDRTEHEVESFCCCGAFFLFVKRSSLRSGLACNSESRFRCMESRLNCKIKCVMSSDDMAHVYSKARSSQPSLPWLSFPKLLDLTPSLDR